MIIQGIRTNTEVLHKMTKCLACRKRMWFWQRKKLNRHGKPFVHEKHTEGYRNFKLAKKGHLYKSEEYLKNYKRGKRIIHKHKRGE